ncbi:MAG: four helix bundle protein [Acidobacteria bacterium]|nr:four helix bundle protein [Acidobacteriota bacterium]
MGQLKSYRDLETWQEGITLVERCYDASSRFPREEMFGLTQQLRRAAVSIPCNIAEGHRRLTRQAYLNHLSIALGSQAEVETCLVLANRLGFLTGDDLRRLEASAASVRRLLFGLVRSLKRTDP